MPGSLALLLCAGLVVWLIRTDARCRSPRLTGLWIPALWVAIIASRPVSFWFSLVGLGGSSESNVEGSRMNLVVLFGLMAAAWIVLQRRRLDGGAVVRQNAALFVLYAFFALTAFWSDYPFATLRRVVKDFGSVLVVLVLLTHEDPGAAIRAVFVRVAYLLFPLSVVLFKYFPEVGRNYSVSGEPMFTGVAEQKNSLGQMVLVLGLFILWDLIETRSRERTPENRMLLRILRGWLLFTVYLLVACRSSTSIVCFLVAAALFLATDRVLKARRPGLVLASLLVAALTLLAMESTFHLVRFTIETLGRNTTLTGRTGIWQAVSEQPTNPLVGCGFLAFWDSEMGQEVIDELATLKTAHNGYVDVYLSGGLVALALLAVLLLAGGRKTTGEMLASKTLFARLAFTLLVTSVVYNCSESSYFLLGPLWFAVLLSIVRCPAPSPAAAVSPLPERLIPG